MTAADALAAVLAAPAGSVRLSRIVAYALGDGDPTSRRSFEKYGPDMHPPGDLKKGSGWLPAHYTEFLDAAGKALPKGWYLTSGVDDLGPFASVMRPDTYRLYREVAATEPLARIAAVLRARIVDASELDPELEDLLS